MKSGGYSYVYLASSDDIVWLYEFITYYLRCQPTFLFPQEHLVYQPDKKFGPGLYLQLYNF